MSFLSSLFRPAPRLDEGQRQALDRWRQRPRPPRGQALDDARFVVIDVETTGLDIRRDRLVSIGAIVVERRAVVLGETLEVVVRQRAPSAVDNILVHQIGGTEQLSGLAPEVALAAFLDFADRDPLVGFNADFDRAIIERAMDDALGLRTDHLWFDVSPLARALLPGRIPAMQTLDAWCAEAGVANYQRHRALSDALATAQLLLVALDAAPAQRIRTVADLQTLERGQRWLEKTGAAGR